VVSLTGRTAAFTLAALVTAAATGKAASGRITTVEHASQRQFTLQRQLFEL
jgi:hypothetical protein